MQRGIKIFHIKIVLFLLSFFFFSPPLFALNEIEQKSIEGRELGFHRKYEETQRLFENLEKEYPESPLGSFGLMTIYQAKMLENYDFRYSQEYEKISERNSLLTKELLKNPNASGWDLFVAGAASGLRSFYFLRKDALFKGLSEGNLSQKLFQRAIEKDPSLIDVQLGIGMYEYWRSVFTQRFKLPFFKDQRKEGIEKIERASREGKIVPPLAKVILAICLNNERNYSKSIDILEEVAKQYPENVVVQNFLIEAYIGAKRYEEAEKRLDQMTQRHPEIIVSKFFQAKTDYLQNHLEPAKKKYETFLELNPSPAWKSYALTDLGFIALKEKNDDLAFQKFREAYHAYSENSLALKELNKLKQKK